MQEVANLRQTMAMGDGERELLRQAEPAIIKHVDRLSAAFYARLSALPIFQQVVGDAGRIPLLQETLHQHIQGLLRSGMDDAYAERSLAIGRTHHRIGLSLDWYMGAYGFLLSELSAVIFREYWARPVTARKLVQALTKLFTMDMCIASQAYFEAIAEAERAESNRTSGEWCATITLAGQRQLRWPPGVTEGRA